MSDVAALLAQLPGSAPQPTSDPALAALKLARATIDALLLRMGESIEARVVGQLAGGLTQLAAGESAFVLKLPTPLPEGAAVVIRMSPSAEGQPAVTVRSAMPASMPAPAAAPASPQPANLISASLIGAAPAPAVPAAPNALGLGQPAVQQAAAGQPPAVPPPTVQVVAPASTAPGPQQTPSPFPVLGAGTTPPPATPPAVLQGAAQPAVGMIPPAMPPLQAAAPAATPVAAPTALSRTPAPTASPAPMATISVVAALQPAAAATPAMPAPLAVGPSRTAPDAASPPPAVPATAAVAQPSPAGSPVASPVFTGPAATGVSALPASPELVVPAAPGGTRSPAPAIVMLQPATPPASPGSVPALPPLPPARLNLVDLGHAAARQDSIAPLMARLAAAVTQGATLPRPVIEVALKLLAGRIDLNRALPDGTVLRDAVLGAGVLADGPGRRPGGTARDHLLQLRSGLMALLGDDAAPAIPALRRPPLPLRGDTPRAPPPQGPAAADLSLPDTARALLGQTDAALSRLKLLQVASHPPNAVRSESHPARPDLRVEIPMLLGAETAILQVQVERDARHRPSPRERAWRMRFAVHFSATGEIGAEVALFGRTASVSVWAADPETADALEAMLPELAPALARQGLDVGAIRVRRGVPAARPQLPGQLLDSAR